MKIAGPEEDKTPRGKLRNPAPSGQMSTAGQKEEQNSGHLNLTKKESEIKN